MLLPFWIRVVSKIDTKRIPKWQTSLSICDLMFGLHCVIRWLHLWRHLKSVWAAFTSKHMCGIQAPCSSIARSYLFLFGILLWNYCLAFTSTHFSTITTASEAIIVTWLKHVVSFCCFQLQYSKALFFNDCVFHIWCSLFCVHDCVFTIVCSLFCISFYKWLTVRLFLTNELRAFRMASPALPLSVTSGVVSCGVMSCGAM